MAGIFPPNGVPPGPNTCNGFTPHHFPTTGSPLYAPPDCTATLLDCTFNAIVSEILAAIDYLDAPYNGTRVDNLGLALLARFQSYDGRITDLDNAKVERAGDTMTGPLMLSRDPVDDVEAVTKQYVDQQDASLNTSLRLHIDQQNTTLQTNLSNRIDDVQANAVLRAGDTMVGALIVRQPQTDPFEAVSKSYVDGAIAQGGTFVDAPADGRQYVRYMNTWVEITPPSLDDGEWP